jgi:rRNA processing protein Krr1/Pno1
MSIDESVASTSCPSCGEAAELVEAIASTLSPERAANLLRAPAITEILSLTRPAPG